MRQRKTHYVIIMIHELLKRVCIKKLVFTGVFKGNHAEMPAINLT